MRTLNYTLTLLAFVCCASAQAALDPAQVKDLSTQVSQRLSGYERFVRQLRLERVPADFPGRSGALLEVDDLGARVEELSRAAGSVSEPGDVEGLTRELARFDTDFTATLRRTRRVAICGLQRSLGVRRPTWGAGTAPADAPVYAAADFAGEVDATIALAAQPGETARMQVVALSLPPAGNRASGPIQTPIKGIIWRFGGPLRGPGIALPASTAAVEPVAWVPPASAADKPQLTRLGARTPELAPDGVVCLLLTLTVPADAKPGEYRTGLSLSAPKHEAVNLKITLTVGAPKP